METLKISPQTCKWHGFKKCVDCHGGDRHATTKEEAHVQPTLPVIMDETVPPLDYDLAYQQFINPSNLRVVDHTCGDCHAHRDEVAVVNKGLMATAAGHYAGGLYLNGVVDSKTPLYGTFAVVDDDGDVPTEQGAVQSLLDLISYDPFGDPSQVSTHFAAVPGQVCARCHLWSRGKGYRGAVGAEGVYRADGCAACHMIYANDGLSLSADASIDHQEPGHPMTHIITKAIPTDQCLHCHHRGARIGLSFTGRAQMPPRLPSGPEVPGTTDVKFNGNYHYSDLETNPPDLHHERGMQCIDCHTKGGVMGDGNIYGHMDQATKVRCKTCHGTPTDKATFIDTDGITLNNIIEENGTYLLTSKVTGLDHQVKQVQDVVDPNSDDYNEWAADAMNANHLKDQGGLECYACHASWTPNCFGCHLERDERFTGLNLVTGQEEIGQARTKNKVFESFKHFSMGPNRKGKISPYIVGCQTVADVTAPDGSKILDFVMPTTAIKGLSGLALNPVNPHTVRAEGEVRSCAECHRSPPSLGLGSGNYALARTYAFVANSTGVQIYDRGTDPNDPTLVGTLILDTAPLAVASLPNIIEGTTDYLYVAAGGAGLSIYDMRSGIPVDPVTVLNGIDAIDVSRAARFLYVVVAGVGINIYDNQDPTQLQLVSTVPIPTAIKAVAWGIHLFVAAGEEGLVVVDIVDHTVPDIVGSLTEIDAVDLTLYAHFQKGNPFAARAYVADPSFGVRVVSLLPDFSFPTLVGGLNLPGASGLDTYTRYLSTQDAIASREHDYLYVAAGSAGLHIYDITDPDLIEEVAVLDSLEGSALDVDVASEMAPPGTDDYALVANSQMGLQVIDVTNPLEPVWVKTVPAPGAARVFVEVQQMDRIIDEQGNELKENSHPGVGVLTRAKVVQVLSADITTVEWRKNSGEE